VAWKKHRLRDQDVYAKVDESGALVTDRDGRVDVVYKAAAGAKVYRAGGKNLTPLGGPAIEIEVGEPAPEKPKAKPDGTGKAAAAAAPANAIHVWTDGACTGNPGPAGVGVVIVDGTRTREISEYLGHGTNNIAELTAILRGLQALGEPEQKRPVLVYSDSSYSIGLLSQAWKAKANQELVAELRAVCRKFDDLRFVKVLGHSGVPLNERTDELARQAVSGRGR
jgi:ribonuclease HI